MKTLYIMVGAPGSGKSTFIREHLHKFAGFTAVESRDRIRFSLVDEDEPYFSKEKLVFNSFAGNIREDLKINGIKNVFADATHLTPASRRKLINAIGAEALKDVKIVALVLDTPKEICLQHNELRSGTRSFVPPSAISRMSVQLEIPNFETDEFLDEIYIIKQKGITIKEKA